jgi:hypothetical protein
MGSQSGWEVSLPGIATLLFSAGGASDNGWETLTRYCLGSDRSAARRDDEGKLLREGSAGDHYQQRQIS